jgi:hypothetical protein
MANYVAHHRKKLYTLARKWLDLGRLLARQGTERDVAMAAEAVRESLIRALEAKRAQVPACEDNADRLRSIDEEISSCIRLSIAEIIASCRSSRTGKPKRLVR